jgi:thioredoxin-like negative regulator of GroEL
MHARDDKGPIRIPSGLASVDRRHPGRATLLFFTTRTSGPARRMESLLAHLASTRRERLRLVTVDADRCPDLADRLEVSEIPSLVLVRERRVLGRIAGRATGTEIDVLLERLDEPGSDG